MIWGMNKNKVVKFFNPPLKQWLATQMCLACGLFVVVTAIFFITEELLEWIPMHETVTGEDIFYEIGKLLQRYALPLKKPVCIVTDGSPPGIGIKNEWRSWW